MFQDRADAAYRLAGKLKGRALQNPLVLAIPRGGVVTGAVLAKELDAELDVCLSRKLRAPGQPEAAVGAIAEDGNVYLSRHARKIQGLTVEYLAQERHYQLAEIARRKRLFRSIRSPAPIAGCSVIVTDDGIATGATMIAALHVIMEQQPVETIVAVPVAHPDRLAEVRQWCDDVVCLLKSRRFSAVSQAYADFRQVDDEQVAEILRRAACFSAVAHGMLQP
jgi:predicted phosphoribosyltransferase